jgi:DNA-binding XRE family transcriptional regulator
MGLGPSLRHSATVKISLAVNFTMCDKRVMQQVRHPLRDWRKENGLTLAALARRLSVAPSHLSQLETHKRGVSLAVAAKLVRETNLPLEAFVKAGGRR